MNSRRARAGGMGLTHSPYRLSFETSPTKIVSRGWNVTRALRLPAQAGLLQPRSITQSSAEIRNDQPMTNPRVIVVCMTYDEARAVGLSDFLWITSLLARSEHSPTNVECPDITNRTSNLGYETRSSSVKELVEKRGRKFIEASCPPLSLSCAKSLSMSLRTHARSVIKSLYG